MQIHPLAALLAMTCLTGVSPLGAQSAELLVSQDGSRTTLKTSGSERLSAEDGEALRALATRPELTSNWAQIAPENASTETLASVTINAAKYLPIEPEAPVFKKIQVIDHYQRALVNDPVYREIQIEAGSAEN